MQLQEFQAKMSNHLFHAQNMHTQAIHRHCLETSPKEPNFRVGVTYDYYNVK